jgi:hypothetical protein
MVIATCSVLRLTGFMHQKGEPFQTRIEVANTMRYTAAEILEAFPPTTDKPDSKYYVDDLEVVERIKLKNGATYPATAVAWSHKTYRAKITITIRYRVETGKGIAYLHEYIQVKHLHRLREFHVGAYTKLHNDLMALGVANQHDINHLSYSVMDEYFNRNLTVTVLNVVHERDPNQSGAKIKRPPSTQYSKVHAIFEAKAK